VNKIICITGASSGFGEACARLFSQHQYDLIITGRRAERLGSLKNELQAKWKNRIHVLAFDVRDRKAVDKAINSLPDEWKAVDILLNNAGLALGRDNFDEADMDDWETMIDTNVKGLLYITRSLLPEMIRRRQGHIINIGSVA